MSSNLVVYRPVGDSPTIKKYIDTSIINEILKKTDQGLLPLTRDLTIEGADGSNSLEVLGAEEYRDLILDLPVKLPVNSKLYKLRAEKSLNYINIVGPSGEVSSAYIWLVLDTPGASIVRVSSRASHSFLGFIIDTRSGIKHDVLVIYEGSENRLDIVGVVTRSSEYSKLEFTMLFKPGQLLYSRIHSTPGDYAYLKKTIIVDALRGSQVEISDQSIINTYRSIVESYLRARLENKSIVVLRGRGVVERRAIDVSVVYGIESLIMDSESRAYMQPFLDIHSNRVKEARHYARNYTITQDKLFYLETRGLSEHEARELLIRGFMTQGLSGVIRDTVFKAIAS